MRDIAQPTQCAHTHRAPYPQEIVRPLWVERLLRQVAAEHRVAYRQVIGEKTKPSVAARHDAMRRLRSHVLCTGQPISFPTIGRWFGRHHTTVMNACGACKK